MGSNAGSSIKDGSKKKSRRIPTLTAQSLSLEIVFRARCPLSLQLTSHGNAIRNIWGSAASN
jgi:hypothetical protein